jgi:hypothetical protein
MTPKLLPALAALALVTACGANPWAVDSYEAPEADVAGKRSFAWKAGDIGASLIKQPAQLADVEARMRTVITAELLRKGYAEAAETAGADMVVSYQVAGSRRYVQSDERRIGAPSPNELLTPGGVPPLPASEVTPEKSIREGTVVVFAEEPASGRLMWRGLVNAQIRVSSIDRTVDQVVDMGGHISEGFPARRVAP